MDGEIFDESSFKKVEKALNNVGVSMETIVNGAPRLREPMEILKDLAKVYNSLDDLDPRKADIISELGGKYRGNQLSALLSNWETYEKILNDYQNSSGSALAEAQKTADSWEGRLNRLTNSWNGFIQNFVNTDIVKGSISIFEGFINVLDKLTSGMAAFPVAAGVAATALSAFKDIGIQNMPSYLEAV